MRKLIHFLRRILGINALLEGQNYYAERTMNYAKQTLQIEKEILYAHKFNSTIVDSPWFKYKNLSPGVAAVDYCFFYSLYKVLNSIKPKSILEFGLGQSSKMVHQYANYYHCSAITVEHDPTWVDFFQEGKDGEYNVSIQLLELENKIYKEAKVLTYKNCYETFKESSFDLIVVDGPFGNSPDTVYSRPQILDLAKSCLQKDFVIMIDDYDRQGERNTVKELFDYFDSQNINYVYSVYSTIKSHILITVPRFHFLTTL